MLMFEDDDEEKATKPNRNQQRIQAIFFLIGSFCFTAGSTMYFTSIFERNHSALTAGGWLFTIGSFIYLLADLQDWHNEHNGFCFDRSSSNSVQIDVHIFGNTSALGFYLVGSILFIPIFETFLTIGEWFFILGSSISVTSLTWKSSRIGWKTLLLDKYSLTMDVLSIIGNLCFFIGTICFLPSINESNFAENRAAFFFVFGSCCFIVSSTILQYTVNRVQ